MIRKELIEFLELEVWYPLHTCNTSSTVQVHEQKTNNKVLLLINGDSIEMETLCVKEFLKLVS